MIVAGLDQDYLGKPFEPMPQLLAIAEYITKTLAICMVCGNPANHTQRLVASRERVSLGAQGLRGALPPLLRPHAVASGVARHYSSVARRVPSADFTRHFALRTEHLLKFPMAWLLPYVLIGLGVGFAVANLRVLAEGARYLRLRKNALLTWQGPPPPYYGLMLFLGVALGVLLIVKFMIDLADHQEPEPVVVLASLAGLYAAVWRRHDVRVLAYAVPLTRKISRGFYAEGVWGRPGSSGTKSGIAWRHGEPPTLLLISRFKEMARPLLVPGDYYSAVRRLLREKIGSHDIMFAGDTLDLAGHDEREDV